MFQRRKPPQLTELEELRQTYNDCCNLTIKNLTLEEQNSVEDALKGWKSLHTSLLFKIELFEKNLMKMGEDELEIFNELKSIRDQNVKHLIRVQLRMDELNRRHAKKPTVAVSPPVASKLGPNNLQNGKMSVPSLRNGGMRQLNGGSQGKKKLLKSLRPQQVTTQSKQKQQQASVAANKSWNRPTPKSHSSANAVLKSDEEDETDLFNDFDQDSFEFSNNWEKIDDNQAKLSPPNLIDLDTDYFQASHSMENLTIKPQNSKSRQSSFDSNSSPKNSIQNLAPPKLDNYQSTSSPDIRTEKKYAYNKPQPIDINRLMKATKSNTKTTPPKKTSSKPPAKPTATAKPSYTRVQSPPTQYKSHTSSQHLTSPPSGSPKQQVAKASPTAKPAKKYNNITYNYVSAQGAKKSPNTKPSVSTPKPKKEEEEEPVDSEEEVESLEDLDENDLLNEKVQDEIIKSIRGIDTASAKQILNDIVVHGDEVYWEDIVGLDAAKNSLKEAVVYPFLRPDLFQGLREPTRGMLLFGPPGTGKTMIARAVATESKSTFFSITSSSITSKYLGESEKLVKALFLLAKRLSPSIVFIDEIDSLLGARSEGEIDSVRRIKNEFLIQWSELSSATTKELDNTNELSQQVLILGATNMPWSIDEAARRRFVKRQYIPLPEDETRKHQIIRLLKYQNNTLAEDDYEEIITLTRNFSGSDITALCKDSAMGPLRSLGDKLLSTPTEQIRPINLEDFICSLRYIKPSVLKESLQKYEEWALEFGSSGV